MVEVRSERIPQRSTRVSYSIYLSNYRVDLVADIYRFDPKYRRQLAVADLPELNILYPRDIRNLSFDNEDRPLGAIEGAAPRWDARTKLALQANITTHLPNFHKSMNVFDTASGQLWAVSKTSGGVPSKTLVETEWLLQRAIAAREAVEALHVISEEEVGEIRRHIEGLRDSISRT